MAVHAFVSFFGSSAIYVEVNDEEEAMAFIQTYYQNPQAILEKITPKKKP
jgi:hypothetical protein